MKDTKQIRRDFHSVAWVMPQGWTLGHWGCPGGNFFKHGHMAYQIDGDDEQNRMQVNPRVKLVTFWRGQMTINFNYKANFGSAVAQ